MHPHSCHVLDTRYTVYYITTYQFSSILPHTHNLKRCCLNTIWNCFTHLLLQSLLKYYFQSRLCFLWYNCLDSQKPSMYYSKRFFTMYINLRYNVLFSKTRIGFVCAFFQNLTDFLCSLLSRCFLNTNYVQCIQREYQ